MFEKENCYRLGHIAKLHGFKGELSISLDTDNPHEYDTLESVFVEYDQKLIPFFLEKIEIRRDGSAVIRFEDYATEEKVKKFIGCSLYMPLEVMPEVDEKRLHADEVIGFEVVDLQHGNIGFIKSVLLVSGNPILEIDFNGQEILIPNQPDFIQQLDRKRKILFLDTPPGLIDLYLGEEE